jgi:hypothetical protein
MRKIDASQPEAFVPLPDGRAIPVKMQGGHGVARVTAPLPWAALAFCLWAGWFYYVPTFSHLTRATRVIWECGDAHCGLRFERKQEARS